MSLASLDLACVKAVNARFERSLQQHRAVAMAKRTSVKAIGAHFERSQQSQQLEQILVGQRSFQTATWLASN